MQVASSHDVINEVALTHDAFNLVSRTNHNWQRRSWADSPGCWRGSLPANHWPAGKEREDPHPYYLVGKRLGNQFLGLPHNKSRFLPPKSHPWMIAQANGDWEIRKSPPPSFLEDSGRWKGGGIYLYPTFVMFINNWRLFIFHTLSSYFPTTAPRGGLVGLRNWEGPKVSQLAFLSKAGLELTSPSVCQLSCLRLTASPPSSLVA